MSNLQHQFKACDTNSDGHPSQKMGGGRQYQVQGQDGAQHRDRLQGMKAIGKVTPSDINLANMKLTASSIRQLKSACDLISEYQSSARIFFMAPYGLNLQQILLQTSQQSQQLTLALYQLKPISPSTALSPEHPRQSPLTIPRHLMSTASTPALQESTIVVQNNPRQQLAQVQQIGHQQPQPMVQVGSPVRIAEQPCHGDGISGDQLQRTLDMDDTDRELSVLLPSDTSAVSQARDGVALDRAFVCEGRQARGLGLGGQAGRELGVEGSSILAQVEEDQRGRQAGHMQEGLPQEEKKQNQYSYETSFDMDTINPKNSGCTSRANSNPHQLIPSRNLHQFPSSLAPRSYTSKFESLCLHHGVPTEQSSLLPDWHKYLACLSTAQTELTYLCQYMHWAHRFLQQQCQITGMYSCRAEVTVIVNAVVRRYQGWCPVAKSKREARHYAAVGCLADVYGSVQGAWQRYRREVEAKPALVLDMAADNWDIVKACLAGRQDEAIKKWSIEEENGIGHNEDITQYLSRLGNCKKQLYYFVAQNNRVFLTPRWLAKAPTILGLWQIEGLVRYEVGGRLYEYREISKGRSKRQCEDKVSKNILSQVYKDFPALYASFRKVKRQRGFP